MMFAVLTMILQQQASSNYCQQADSSDIPCIWCAQDRLRKRKTRQNTILNLLSIAKQLIHLTYIDLVCTG